MCNIGALSLPSSSLSITLFSSGTILFFFSTFYFFFHYYSTQSRNFIPAAFSRSRGNGVGFTCHRECTPVWHFSAKSNSSRRTSSRFFTNFLFRFLFFILILIPIVIFFFPFLFFNFWFSLSNFSMFLTLLPFLFFDRQVCTAANSQELHIYIISAEMEKIKKKKKLCDSYKSNR